MNTSSDIFTVTKLHNKAIKWQKEQRRNVEYAGCDIIGAPLAVLSFLGAPAASRRYWSRPLRIASVVYRAAVLLLLLCSVVNSLVTAFLKIWSLRNYILMTVALAVRGSQLVAYPLVLYRSFATDDRLASVLNKIAKIDRLLNIGRFERPSFALGVMMAALPIVGYSVLFINDVLYVGWSRATAFVPWHIMNVVVDSEVMLCSCFLLVLAERLSAVAAAVGRPQRAETPPLGLDVALGVIREVVDCLREINILFRKQLLGFFTTSFVVLFYYEGYSIQYFRKSGSWGNLVTPALDVIKVLSEVLVLCWAAERLRASDERLRAALQRRTTGRAASLQARGTALDVIKVISEVLVLYWAAKRLRASLQARDQAVERGCGRAASEEARRARSLLRLLGGGAASEFSLYGLAPLRLRLVPTLCGIFASCSVLFVQINQ